MARKSQRLSDSTSMKSTHKRTASATATQAADAKRSKTKKATPAKSQYFDDDEEGTDLLPPEDDGSERSSAEDEVSDFHGSGGESSLSEQEAESDYDSEEAPKARKKPTPKKSAASTTTIRTKSNELWREGVKAGLGPGTQVVIKKPKARPAGKTPYTDDTIHPNTFLFLKDLKANNDREWLKSKCLHAANPLNVTCTSAPSAVRQVFLRARSLCLALLQIESVFHSLLSRKQYDC